MLLFSSSAVLAQEVPLQSYPPEVRSVVEQRCMVCHGCYDAPCQLKLDDWAGLERGGNKDKVYDGTRLLPQNLTRLHEDARSVGEWREKGFYPVLDEEDPRRGVLYRMLELKEKYPLPNTGAPLPDSFDFSLDRDQSCPKQGEFEEYAEDRPYQGMPYGFPGLDADRRAALTRWLEAGAPGAEMPAVSEAEQRAVAGWEAFFNAPDNKTRLMSRYIYEHLFIGSLYFDDLPAPSGWYKLVRSATPPGQPIKLIATRRPYDDPGVAGYYYRLERRSTSLLAKRHMPYALSEARMARWKTLFLEPEYEVRELPGFEGKDAANPFVIFEKLPVEARYQFMLDEAHFTIMAYIKGPVCRGQVALNVIDDHFWVAFVKPNRSDPDQHADFLASESHHMRLPQPKGSFLVTLLQWRSYAKGQKRYLKAQAREIAKVLDRDSVSLDMNLIWDGGPERNDNAALTVFRHFDSASVVKGFVGQKPYSMWVIDYSLLERIHYLLVAGFDVYGAVGHQLESRLYMDFLRMEGEQAFLMLLPAEQRIEVRNQWYRGARDHVKEFLVSEENAEYERDTGIAYQTDDPVSELLDLFMEYVPAGHNPRYAVKDAVLRDLMAAPDKAFSFMPEASFLQVLPRHGEPRVYSLIHNRAHSNNAQLFLEDNRLLPEEDTLTVASGFIGAYPNMFFQVTEGELQRFVDAIRGLKSDVDYTALVGRFGVRRSAPWFWKLSDDFTAQYRSAHPLEAGLFDLNRYENR